MAFTTYANTGPFNNNALPALTATFFNNVEVFLDQIKSSAVTDTGITTDGSGDLAANSFQPNQSGTKINGSVGGSTTFFTPIWGTGMKVIMADLSSWNSASVATFTLPGSGIAWGWYFSGISGGVTTTWGLFISSTAQVMRHLTGLGANNAAGTENAETAVHTDNMGSFALTGGAATSMQVGTTSGAVTGIILIIGN